MATIKKAQAGITAKKPVVKVEKKTTIKVTPKKVVKRDRTKDNPADEYKGMKDAQGNPAVDVGGEGRRPPFKKGGVVKKAKTGGSFPDLNKDGKITKADILKGRGVIAKKGAKMKKAQTGDKLYPTSGIGKNVPAKSGKSMKKCKGGC